MLRVEKITKQFGNKVALGDLSFNIAKGEIVGLVGPNGSGKTTLLNILMGMIKPDSGSFAYSEPTRIGMSVSRSGFFDDMTVEKNIGLFGKLVNADKKDVDTQLNNFAIDFRSLRFGKLSAGMKQRVSLLLPFITKNDLILLDEPSNHLDIDSILKLRQVIISEKESGVSFLITSHIFSDLEKVCHRILFLKNGKLLKDSPTGQLIQQYGNLEEAYISILETSK